MQRGVHIRFTKALSWAGICWGLLGACATWAQTTVTAVAHLRPAGRIRFENTDVQGTVWKQGARLFSDSLVLRVAGFKSGIDLRDQHLQRWLEAQKFPEIRLTQLEGSEGKAKSKIKLKGVEAPLDWTYESESASDEAKDTILARASLDVKAFQLEPPQFLGIRADAQVLIEVRVTPKSIEEKPAK